MRVSIVLFEGFDELDAIGPFEVFETAAAAGADLETTLCTIESTEEVAASHGLSVRVDATLEECDPDLLLVPGGAWTDPDGPGVRREYDDGAIPAAIADVHDDGATVASVCTGAMLLSKAGVLADRPATTHHDAAADLAATSAHRTDARVVDDGDVLTCGGVTAGLDLAVHVVAREFDDEITDAVLTEMAYDRTDDVHETTCTQ
jgi:transcriptional regulator GlxA family with amidase domain